MRKKLWLAIPALALCLAFTGCGNNTSATPDQAAQPSLTAPAGTSAASSQASSGASSKPVASSAQNGGEQKEQQQEQKQPEQDNQEKKDNGEQKDNQEQQEQQEKPASQNEDSKQDEQSASSGVAEPMYSEDEKPSYTIAVTNKGTHKAYSASCGTLKDRENAGGVNFFLPSGEYHIAIYRYNDGKTLGAPLMTKEYKLEGSEDQRKTVKIVYVSDPKAIEVEEVKTDRTQ